MRDILFRGKTLKEGSWICGSLLVYPDGVCFICCPSKNDADVLDRYLIIPKTVGQFTGLTDKNGVRIFEGDVVKTKKYGKIVEHSNVNDYDIFVVTYEPCAFRLINKTRGFYLIDDGYSKLEVIGNIHDNPLMRATGEDIGNAAQDALLPAT